MSLEKDIAEGNIGAIGAYDIEFKDGKLSAIVKLDRDIGAGLSLSGNVRLDLSAEMVLDALAKAIPGTLDDAVFELAKKALKA